MTCLRQLYEELEAGVLLNEIVTPDVNASIHPLLVCLQVMISINNNI